MNGQVQRDRAGERAACAIRAEVKQARCADAAGDFNQDVGGSATRGTGPKSTSSDRFL